MVTLGYLRDLFGEEMTRNAARYHYKDHCAINGFFGDKDKPSEICNNHVLESVRNATPIF